jgi:hypothetical protein
MIYDYQIIDVNEPKKMLKVVYESDNRRDAEETRDRFKMVGCEVYAEVGGKLYRIICEQEKVTSNYARP